MHPAMQVPFRELLKNLRQAEKNGLVRSKTNGDLTLWCYTEQAQYHKQWDDTTICARGLITSDSEIVALPFPKFFNLSEHGPEWKCPDGQPSFFEKVDGSLGILFHYNGKWSCATNKDAKGWDAVMRKIRPTANNLE